MTELPLNTASVVDHYLAASRRSEKRNGWTLLAALVLVFVAGAGVVLSNHTASQESGSISTLTTQLGNVQKKSAEQTKAEVQLRHDVSQLVGITDTQAKLLGTYHGANTQFFEYLRELIVDSANIQNDTGHARQVATADLHHVERKLAQFRFPQDRSKP